jgi:CRP/FNR family transcriptional regulator, cyclic AMP receptor protein
LLAVGAGDTLAREPTTAVKNGGLGMAADPEIVEALGATDLFAGLGTKALTSIAAQARIVHHPEGKDITEQGGGAAGFHLIKEGTASVHVGGKDRPDIGPGSYFGEISMIDGQPRSATVHAETEMSTISIPSWSFHPVLEDEPEVAKALLKVLCARLRAAEA